MKKLIFFLLISNSIFAQSGLKITAGPNFSSFLNEKDAEMYIGYTFGLQYEYDLSKILSITSGLLYSKEGSIIKDIVAKPLLLSEGATRAEVFYEDIHAVIGYLKIPILLDYSFIIFKKSKSKFYIGGSLLYALKDYSYSDNYRFAFEYYVGETEYDFEYNSYAESFFFENDFNYSLDVGFSQNYKNFNLELILNYHISDFGYVASISEIKKNLISVKCTIGYQF